MSGQYSELSTSEQQKTKELMIASGKLSEAIRFAVVVHFNMYLVVFRHDTREDVKCVATVRPFDFIVIYVESILFSDIVSL